MVKPEKLPSQAATEEVEEEDAPKKEKEEEEKKTCFAPREAAVSFFLSFQYLQRGEKGGTSPKKSQKSDHSPPQKKRRGKTRRGEGRKREKEKKNKSDFFCLPHFSTSSAGATKSQGHRIVVVLLLFLLSITSEAILVCYTFFCLPRSTNAF